MQYNIHVYTYNKNINYAVYDGVDIEWTGSNVAQQSELSVRGGRNAQSKFSPKVQLCYPQKKFKKKFSFLSMFDFPNSQQQNIVKAV